jgi:glycosyltransferase involved in cell wall biosynthesis
VKVLHLTAGNLYGGIETYLMTLARLRHLCPEMEPHFGVCFPGRLRDELLAAAVPVLDLGPVRLSRPWTVLRARRQLIRTLRDHEITLAITHGTWPHAVFAPAARKADARLVNFVHDSLSNAHWINRWAARTPPDAVLANSRFTAATVERVFPGVAAQVCYLPVAPAQVERPEHARREIRKELKTSQDSVVVLQASRLERWKGHLVLLEALSRLKEEPNWQLWIAGGPQKNGEADLLEELKAAASNGGIADRVRFLGQRSDIPRLMAAADIYSQPNTGPEPFGIALVEALAARLPVVTSDLGGAREIVAKECGVLCPPGDAGSVANALRSLILQPAWRQTLGEAGPARAGELCDPKSRMIELAAKLEAVGAVSSR